ncbi:FecR family protein [Chitinophaga defluvii]|uniref:FecR domain-containing protein n=1 Tax=Chitinophaga defluvii TaxID=3163343 RepID=A0ABV2T7R0_9BACT
MEHSHSQEYIDDLIIRFLSGQVSRKEQDELEAWVAADVANHQYFVGLRDAWQVAVAPADAAAQYPAGDAWNKLSAGLQSDVEEDALVIAHQSSRWKTFLRMAAMFILPLVIGGGIVYAWMFAKKGGSNQQMVTITSPKGATTQIELSDGTQVWLNAGSKLQYSQAYNTTTREVKLEGEAFFDVKTNAAKPFTVNAADLEIQALGTSFNVKAYPEDKTVVTTLVEGVVKINGSQEAKAFSLLLKPNQNVTYHKTIPVKAKVQPLAGEEEAPVESREVKNTAVYTAWKDGNWIVNAQSMEELAITMERRFNVSVVFKDELLKRYKFSGTFTQETLEQVLNILKLTAPLRYTIDHGTVTLELDKELKEKYANALPSGNQ